MTIKQASQNQIDILADSRDAIVAELQLLNSALAEKDNQVIKDLAAAAAAQAAAVKAPAPGANLPAWQRRMTGAAGLSMGAGPGMGLGMASFDTGTACVERDQIAAIHRQEMIIDPTSARVLRDYGITINGDNGSDNVVAAIENADRNRTADYEAMHEQVISLQRHVADLSVTVGEPVVEAIRSSELSASTRNVA